MHQMLGYDVSYELVIIMCDNTSAISISKNIAHCLKAKDIDIKHHFII